jgi:uncharacterized RmlC-like cupin family protein
MSKIQALKREALSESSTSPGITRHLAFKDEGSKVLRSQTEPGTVSGWHHHGDYEVYGYVVSGSVRLENGSDKENAISIGPGDFLHVPPHTVHREINPSSDEANDIILFLRGNGPLVVNVDNLEQA